jgi:hypothetical protein
MEETNIESQSKAIYEIMLTNVFGILVKEVKRNKFYIEISIIYTFRK